MTGGQPQVPQASRSQQHLSVTLLVGVGENGQGGQRRWGSNFAGDVRAGREPDLSFDLVPQAGFQLGLER